ncbi:hypothetical protein O7622_07325 [Micromonospora sp. WMMD1076]|uniref:hypothetical protein n=1 Tax=Micromonospora sp. WMMD1076 TaxID=3016103 RepID=UPI00249B1DBB|nr:hypothetical protein [Micromonospora sp. WMMD1076]WFF08361.1 hypothetical protein O7622_07325 [Micromonospora sp. WMMD1076]
MSVVTENQRNDLDCLSSRAKPVQLGQRETVVSERCTVPGSQRVGGAESRTSTPRPIDDLA